MNKRENNVLDLKGKNGRDNNRYTEKHYFHCDSQTEKAIKSYCYYLWKEMVILIAVITKIKIKLVTMETTVI